VNNLTPQRQQSSLLNLVAAKPARFNCSAASVSRNVVRENDHEMETVIITGAIEGQQVHAITLKLGN
jgi:hypothetical protein